MPRIRIGVVFILSLLICSTASAASSVRCRFEQAPSSKLQQPAVVISHITKVPKIDGVIQPHEWDEAEGTSRFVDVGTVDTTDPQTKAWLAVDGVNLYAAFRCNLASGFEPKAAAKNRDGVLWEDDAIELFIHPDVSKKDYYQFTVNCTGVQGDAKFTTLAPLEVKANALWNPKWTARTGREKDAWTLEAAIPLSEIGMKPGGTQLIRMNICRDIWTGSRRISSWSNLSTRGGDIHNRPHEFGMAVCTFGARKGDKIDYSKVIGLKGLDLLSVDNPDQVVLLPSEYSVTIAPRAAMPAKLVADAGYAVQASICPVLSPVKDGKNADIGKYRLKSADPVKATLTGLNPGDYKLKLTMTGPGVSTSTERLIQVRNPHAQPLITERTVIDDRDWRSPESTAKAVGIERTITPELMLQTQFKTPVLLFDPTDDQTITCMTDFQGKLYIGSCTEPAATDTGSVFTYDPGLDVWKKVFQVNDQGLVDMDVFGDRLYVPGYDANDGGWDLGNIYIHDGKGWVEKRTVPRAIHIYGLVVYHDRIYVSADILDPAPEGVPFQEAVDKNMVKVYGRVVSSGDGGETWREEYRGKRDTQDIGYMTVFQDKIILNASNDIIVFDGKTWTPLGLNPPVLFVYDYGQEGDTLLLATQYGLFYFDGSRLWRSYRMWPRQLRGMTKYGDNWLLAGYSVVGSWAGHGPGGGRYPLKEKDTPQITRALTVYPSKLLIEPPDSLEWGPDNLWKQYKWIDPKETVVSCRSFRGRVYLGTHPEGRVLVLPVCTAGTLVSSPRKLDGNGMYRLWCDAETPLGTSVSFQIRTAPSIEELEKKPFTGSDGTTKTYFESQGSAFKAPAGDYIQYRLTLRTSDPAKTPYVKRVVVTSLGT